MRGVGTFLLALSMFFILGCSDKVNVVLLPEEGGRIGVIEFTEPSGKQHVISRAWETLEIAKSGKAEVKLADEQTVMKKYGETISAMPPKPKSYMIFFGSDSALITPEAKIELTKAAKEINGQKTNVVMCAGHTDSTGSKQHNQILSMKRATSVSKELVMLGVDRNIIETKFYGDADLLVKTEKGVSHPKNRRVEIIVK